MSTISARSDVRPYQQVDGLQEIYVGTETAPSASFVFASNEQAAAAHENVAKAVRMAQVFAQCHRTPDLQKKFVEVHRSSNISPKPDSLVISFCGKIGGTAGAPILNIHDLLDRLGKAMMQHNPTQEINVVKLYAVDH